MSTRLTCIVGNCLDLLSVMFLRPSFKFPIIKSFTFPFHYLFFRCCYCCFPLILLLFCLFLFCFYVGKLHHKSTFAHLVVFNCQYAISASACFGVPERAEPSHAYKPERLSDHLFLQLINIHIARWRSVDFCARILPLAISLATKYEWVRNEGVFC